MKKFSIISLAVFVVLVSFLFLGPHQEITPFPSERQFEITYAVSLVGLPQDSERIRIWIPLASSREGQTVLERKITGLGDYVITKDPAYGNEMAYFEIRNPNKTSFDFKTDYKAVVTRPVPLSSGRQDNLQTYLKPSRLMVVDEEVRKRTRNAIQGKKTWAEEARAIYEDVIRRMSYDKTAPGWGRGDTVRACLLGKGNCTDFHSLFISMAHAAEIPARFKIGLTVPDGAEGEIPGYHCWAEFYEEGQGWQPVDASEAWKHPERKEAYFGNFDTNKFLISVGRDIDLVPKQSGPPVNIFFYPYVEVDGKEWNGVKTSFQFKNLKT